MSTDQALSVSRKHARAATVAAAAAMFLICMDTLITNVALPTIEAELGGGMGAEQWIVDGYTLPLATLLLLAGNLSDRLGARRVFAWGMAAFGAASAVCGVASSVGMLVFGRAVLGIAAALVLPSSMALIEEGCTDAADRARALALWGVGGSVAAAFGPILGGFLVPIHWSLIFFVNVPVCAAVLAICPSLAPSPTVERPVDVVGQLLSIAGVGGIVAGIIEGGDLGFAHPLPLVLLAVGACSLAAFLAVEKRAENPMMPLSLMARPGIRSAMVGGFVMILNWNATIFVVTLFLQSELGLSPLQSGLAFVPSAVVGIVGNLLSSKLVTARGHKPTVLLGTACMVLGFGLLVAFAGSMSRLLAAAVVSIVGCGGALATPALSGLVLIDAGEGQSGVASALFNTMRQVGGAVGIAAFGVIVAAAPSFSQGLATCGVVSLALVAALIATVAASLAR